MMGRFRNRNVMRKLIYMKKRGLLVCTLVVSAAMVCGGCGNNSDSDKTTGNVSVIEGDDVREYNSGSDETTGAVKQESEEDTDLSLKGLGKDDSVGGLAGKLNIPDSADIDISADNCGTIESACIKADKIQTPDSDRMYTKKFTMGKLSASDREEILKRIFDKEDGVFEYPYDLKDEVDQEQIDAIFSDKGGSVDYSKDYFIGKIDGIEYIIYFFDQSWSTDEGFEIKLAVEKDVPEDMQKLGANFVSYMTYNMEELDSINRRSPIWAAVDEENKCKLNPDEAISEAMDRMTKWGFKDVASTEENEIYREYGYYDANGGDEACGYEKNGYSIGFEAAVAGQPIYQPEAFGVDTISHQSNSDTDFDPGNYYYMEKSEYNMQFDSEGLISFICTWPMTSVVKTVNTSDISTGETADNAAYEEVVEAGSLISWDQAVDSLERIMPEHFSDYTGYNKVCFNDVRLTYFRIKTEDGGYEAVPVYVFAQLDEERGSDDSYPIQLIMIDARDGSEVNIVQDESRFGKN